MSIESGETLPGTRQERQRAWLEQARHGAGHGGFAAALADAFNRADDENAARLATAFPELFDCLAAAQLPLCCWCDEPANGQPVRYAGLDHPACSQHSAEYRAPITYTNEDFDRINRACRNGRRPG